MSIPFTFLLIVLASYRLQRIVTTDSWFPTQAFRTYLHKRAKPDLQARRQTFWTESAEFFSCPHCLGWWTALLLFLLMSQIVNIPLPLLQAIAGAGAVSVIANVVENE